MKIIFSKHAKLRCAQRKIPEQWVVDLLQNISLSPGNHQRLMEKTRLIIVYHDGESVRTVITLFANQLYDGAIQSKVKNLSNQAKDLLEKGKQKHNRRHKKSRVHKFKKR